VARLADRHARARLGTGQQIAAGWYNRGVARRNPEGKPIATWKLALGAVLGGIGLAWLFSGRRGAGTIFTIVMENHSASQIFGNPDCPFMNQLAQQYGVATNFRSSTHPSLPNYLVMTSGSTQGVGDDGYHLISGTDNIFAQMDDAGIAWRAYAESMPRPCATSDTQLYASRHNPAVYYQSVVQGGSCTDRVVDMSTLWGDLSSNAVRYAWITPNIINDMHDGSPAQADAWLQQVVPSIQASPGYQQGGVIFILWDEGDESGRATDPDLLPAIVVSERLRSRPLVDSTAYDHRSYLAAVQDLLGLPRLPATANVNSMAAMLA